MKTVAYILLMLLCCLTGAFNIACAWANLEQKRGFLFGVSVMYAAATLMLMAELTSIVFGGA